MSTERKTPKDHWDEQLPLLQSRLNTKLRSAKLCGAKPRRRQTTTRPSPSRLAKHPMALPHGPPGVDAQMPTMRSRLRRPLHRRRHLRLNRSMDPDSNAGDLCNFTRIPCRQILSQALPGPKTINPYDLSLNAVNFALLRRNPLRPLLLSPSPGTSNIFDLHCKSMLLPLSCIGI